MRTALASSSIFTAAAGLWLFVMENWLKHSGYATRSAIAACIVAQSVITLLWLVRDGGKLFRSLVLSGAVGVFLLGITAIETILTSPHFEGFVLLIGGALIVEGLLALVAVLRAHRPQAT